MIELDALTRRYGEATVVDAVSFTVERGTIAAVVGPSGSGKTTLVRMVNRLVEPTAGTVRIDGVDARSLEKHALRRRIGYVIQNHGLFPHRTVGANIATVPKLLGWPRARIEARVGDLLTLFQLDPDLYAGRYPHELSGGQQQRVGVARALAAEPALLLMDEPFGALDPIIRAKVQDDLKAIQRRLGTTILLVTHDMEEAISLADRIAVLDGGRLAQYGTPAEILRAPSTAVVEALIANAERPFRLLSLTTVADAVEAGAADGPPLPGETTLRDALADLLWRRRGAAPVVASDGSLLGRITLESLLARAGRPA